MKHYKLGRKSAHRKSTVKNLVASLILHERIITTLPKAKLTQRLTERLITRVKKADIPNGMRIAMKLIGNKNASLKTVELLKGRYGKIQSGYTRIIKTENRKGDNAQQVILEFTIKTEDIATKAKSNKSAKNNNIKTTIKSPVKP